MWADDKENFYVTTEASLSKQRSTQNHENERYHNNDKNTLVSHHNFA